MYFSKAIPSKVLLYARFGISVYKTYSGLSVNTQVRTAR